MSCDLITRCHGVQSLEPTINFIFPHHSVWITKTSCILARIDASNELKKKYIDSIFRLDTHRITYIYNI